MAAKGEHVDFNPQLVARNHGSAKARALDAGKDHQLAVPVFDLGEQKHGAGLGHGLNYQHAGHDGIIWEMSLKEGLVDSDIFDRHQMFLAANFHNAIEQ